MYLHEYLCIWMNEPSQLQCTRQLQSLKKCIVKLKNIMYLIIYMIEDC